MIFTDPQLQKCYDSNFAEAGDLSNELRQVRALVAVHDVFQAFEGPHSARVHETLEHLLRPELRPGLRAWFQRPYTGSDSAAIALRDHLSQLTGERLESNSLSASEPA